MKPEDQLAHNWFIFNVFNIFDFTNFVLVLFPLCLFWTQIFLSKNGTNQIKWVHSIILFAFSREGCPLKCKRMQTGREEGHFITNICI